jgi:ribosome-associated protein
MPVMSDMEQPRMQGFTLDRFLKYESIAETGGQAKLLIQSGEVKVNGAVETRRRKRLESGDRVEALGEVHVVP